MPSAVEAEATAPDAAAVIPEQAVAPGDLAKTDAEAAPTHPYRQAHQAQETRAAEQARRSDSARADSEFAATVKGLMAELKAMARKAEQDAKTEGEAPPQDLAAVDQALQGIQTDLGAASGALSGAMVSLTV